MNPRFTSSFCPRCGTKGVKILDPDRKVHSKYGRFFFCPKCKYLGDRDYIGH